MVALLVTADRVLAAIVAHLKTFGYPPSVREIADAVGLSGATVHEHLGSLVEAGKIRRVPHVARGITVETT